ncbi:camphor resistance protein CrcB [Mesocricetibacter intestinalis]|uniref:Fluoride-specific ion channel FluC n=1 Tax=Mesocricetibacter intestinalis TaxID=1521930 RepID=A0A4R6VAY7_9PAST|nr:fluoride efflux transporter CrcB [Mesocricetibacter intestinalis]TDQ56627.1 camphor resistance protein CrcB [Mesocricetibacter intestinalis]
MGNTGLFHSALLISSGAVLGALLRWGLGLWLNPLFSWFSFGTLAANYLGCFIIGMLMALIWQFPQLDPQWRLFLITGFLGSLTTFSALSAEVTEFFFRQRWTEGFGVLFLHLCGGLLFTWFGALWVRWLS